MPKDSGNQKAKAKELMREVAIESYFAYIEWPILLLKRSGELDKHLAVMDGQTATSDAADGLAQQKAAPVKSRGPAQAGKKVTPLGAPSPAPEASSAAMSVPVEQPLVEPSLVAIDVQPSVEEGKDAVTDFLGDFLSDGSV